ncbi:MAG: FAD-dependent oxidoreductase [Patescibacteria group bacterium]|jgi:alkyl hydroperoxide reductase subunit F|nr:FAD-dependent oxidoreductase [Patescibacteria group bacterium]
MFDLIIIGGGPAAASGAVYAARKQLKTLLIAGEFGGQSVVSEKIFNWIGTPEISGADLAKSFKDHVKYYEGEFLTIKEGSLVEKVAKTDGGFSVSTNKGENFDTKTILVASGSSRRKLPDTVVGANQLEHKGLTYCATCDGPMFSGLDVVVLGGGNAGFETAAQLLAYTKSVTLIHRGAEFKADKITVDKVLSHPKMTGILNAEVTEILGDKFVSGIKFKVDGEEKTLDAKGIFVEIGQIPNTSFLEGVVTLDDYKRVKIDPWRKSSEVPGIWAAGDCTNILYHQNNIAAGDAVTAIEDIYMFLHTK